MTVYSERPWLARYRDDYPRDVEPEYRNLLEMFRASLARDPDCEIVRYFDGVLTLRELDALSDGFAVALVDRGFAPGDRLATFLQNIPQVLVVALGTWKAGGVVVSINPMSRAREVATIVADCAPSAIVAQEDLWPVLADVVRPRDATGTGFAPSPVPIAFTTSPLEFQTRHDPRLFAGVTRLRREGAEDLLEKIGRAHV